MSTWIQKGIDHFFLKKYSEALSSFSLALHENPEKKEAIIGALLSDMAQDSEEQAVALFEYYLLTKDGASQESEVAMEEIIHSVDQNRKKIAHLFEHTSFEAKLNAENGIKYEDFITFTKERGNFKEAFEDIMFSTKVIISRKEDFVDFLEKLIENGFVEISMNYLESAVTLFPNDDKLLSLIKKVHL